MLTNLPAIYRPTEVAAPEQHDSFVQLYGNAPPPPRAPMRFCEHDTFELSYSICTDSHFARCLTCHDTVEHTLAKLKVGSIKQIFDAGLHEFLTDFIRDNNRLGDEVAAGYRFH